jgi:hypothetical protein
MGACENEPLVSGVVLRLVIGGVLGPGAWPSRGVARSPEGGAACSPGSWCSALVARSSRPCGCRQGCAVPVNLSWPLRGPVRRRLIPDGALLSLMVTSYPGSGQSFA